MTPNAPRPFYVVGHNPNSIPEALAYLRAGANAIEPDVNAYEKQPTELCISEAGVLDQDKGGSPSAPSLASYLTQLHQIAVEQPALALVVFDCKPQVAESPTLGSALLEVARDRLTRDTGLNVIVSGSSLRRMQMFTTIAPRIGPREGLMIDEENDPVAVSNAFQALGVDQCCYGNGTVARLNSLFGARIRSSMERACAYRASAGKLRFIYAWTINDAPRMRQLIRVGADGIITDHPDVLAGVVREPEFAPLIRYAARADQPLRAAPGGYGLTVRTSDKLGAGTDAGLTFTLSGALDSASVSVETALTGRMEQGDTNYVTLQSGDLGNLLSLSIATDHRGFGAGWHVDRVDVESSSYHTTKTAQFDRWIDSKSGVVTVPLV